MVGKQSNIEPSSISTRCNDPSVFGSSWPKGQNMPGRKSTKGPAVRSSAFRLSFQLLASHQIQLNFQSVCRVPAHNSFPKIPGMSKRRPTDEVLLMSEAMGDHAGGTPSSEQGDSLMLSQKWTLTKLFLRSAVIVASFLSTIVSTVWIKTYVSQYGNMNWGDVDSYYPVRAFTLLPLCALPSVIITSSETALAQSLPGALS